MQHFFSVDDLTVKDIYELFEQAKLYRFNPPKVEEQIFVANLFFEPSTRTKTSFTIAERKLGLEVLDFEAATSSLTKGESLYDTARTMESIGANLLVVRHEDDNWIDEIEGLSIPIINAGAGKNEHPTQSLLDVYTIYEEFGDIAGLNVVIAGDIVHSRVAHSNIKLLSRLGANVFVTGAPQFIDTSIPCPYLPIDEAVEKCDVLMLLRIQHERHTEIFDESTYLEKFGLTVTREKQMKHNAIILHPAPVNRGVEIDSSLVECERSRIFKQMENGVYIRMAMIIKKLLQWGIIHDNNIKKCKHHFGKQRIKNL